MQLTSTIVVSQNIDQVTQFFYTPSSLAKWDRSVAEMIPTSSVSTDSDEITFDTVSPSGMRMSYKIIEFGSDKRSVKVLLTKSKMFKEAIWHFQFAPVSEGTLITCHVYFALKLWYLFLYPVLYLNKRALLRDLTFLKIAINENFAPS